MVNTRMAKTASKVTFGIICFGVFLPKRSSITWNFILEGVGEREIYKRKAQEEEGVSKERNEIEE